MLRTTLIALSCVVMLWGCSKEKDTPSAKDDTPSPSTPSPASNTPQQPASPTPNTGTNTGIVPPRIRPPIFVVQITPRKVVEGAVSAINAGRFDDALKYMSSRSIAAAGGPEKVRAGFLMVDGMERALWRRGMHIGLTVKSEEVNDQKAQVHAMVDNYDGKGAMPKTYQLVRENNAWKIDSMNNG